MHRKNLALMLLPRLNRKIIKGNIEEFQRAVPRGDDKLVLVRFRPGGVKEGVLGVEPVGGLTDLLATGGLQSCMI